MIPFLIVTAAIICAIFITLKPWRAIAGYESPAATSGMTPKISIVVVARGNEDYLPQYIENLFRQDYPDFEVVLVCDASAEQTAMISESLEQRDRLHITFIPQGSHHLSRRKLAQTIGIKGSTAEIIIMTSTLTSPESDMWIRTMAAPFADSDVAMSLGHIHPDKQGFKKFGAFKTFDSVTDSMQWIGAAILKEPFRAEGFNLAFRKSLFFKNKGYASTNRLVDGDDDIFVVELSKQGNCIPVISHDALLSWTTGEDTDRVMRNLKDRYLFTRSFLPKKPFLLSAFNSAIQWIVLIVGILGILLTLPIINTHIADTFPTWHSLASSPAALISNSAMAAAILTILIIAIPGFFIYELLLFRACSRKLEEPFSAWSFIPFLLWRPVANLCFRLYRATPQKAHLTRNQ